MSKLFSRFKLQSTFIKIIYISIFFFYYENSDRFPKNGGNRHGSAPSNGTLTQYPNGFICVGVMRNSKKASNLIH